MSGPKKHYNRFLIAIVDDDQSVCEGLESLLKSIGFRTETFASAHDFLGSPQLPNVSCLILDINMPNMSGFELQKQLVAKHPVPVIFITAHGDRSTEQQVSEAGAIGLLRKPFSDEALIDALGSAIGDV
jgi:FixJ family two-component response regulator